MTERCGQCGFEYGSVADVPSALRQVHGRFHEAMPVDPTVRRSPEVWSPLEYTCHVRDVLLVQRDRIVVTLVEDGPSFTPMYRGHRARFYEGESPEAALEGLGVAACLLARLLDRLTPEELGRSCTYGYPEPRVVDVAWVAQHTLHEVEHHLLDVTGGPT